MLLIDRLNEQRLNFSFGPGVNHDDLLMPLRRRASQAQVFVLDRDVMTMAASVSLSKPSSILMSLPLVRLPVPLTWIEFNPEDSSAAMADLGSPNIWRENGVARLKAAGFLLAMRGTTLIAEMVHRMEPEGRPDHVDMSSVRLLFDLAEVGEIPPAFPRDDLVHQDAKGRVRQHLKLLFEDPDEANAYAEIERRLEFEIHEDMEPAAHALEQRGMRLTEIAAIHSGWWTEMKSLFLNCVLPALLLMNSKNAVDVGHAPSLAKLNKARGRKGRLPLVEHKLVTMHITKAMRQVLDSVPGGTGRRLRSHLCVGHFKRRETTSGPQLLWWNSHIRGNALGAITRRTSVRL